MPSQLSIVKRRKLQLILCTVLITGKEETSEREHDDINDANETNENSNEQDVHTDTMSNCLINVDKNKKIRK